MATPRAAVRRAPAPPARLSRFPTPEAVKVPVVLAVFWLVKLATTAFGEAFSDSLGAHVVIGAAVELAMVTSAAWLQFRATRYRATVYWYLAAAIATFGTGVADVTHQIGLSYSVTSAGWAIVLAAVFVAWYRTEGTLSIHSITTRRREVFYWCTVFATFALGTALGDWTADVVGLGYLPSAAIFSGLIVAVFALWRLLPVPTVIAFWSAYVLTRPAGASFADYFSRSTATSGAGYGPVPTAAVLGVLVVAGIAYLHRSGVDRPDAEGRALDVPAEPVA
ncbi:MAG TPA: hypothetical protein VFP61_13650 [Acidimicrobiales bacterium]|nr:hypothetical protein [Acidimicrobiales bacterium]